MTYEATIHSSAPSMWHEDLPVSGPQHAPLNGDIDVDVAIVGGGYTGLWTAYYLKRADPKLRIAVLEAEYIGYGASGRNGGWASAIFPASLSKVAKSSSREAAIRMQHAMNDTVAELGRVVAAEGLDCDYQQGGYVSVARNRAQLQHARNEIAGLRDWGFGEDQAVLLDRAEAQALIGASDVLGGTFSPHLAALHPAKLAMELGRAVVDLGVSVYEGTRVTDVRAHELSTARGRVKAEYIVLGTEAYSCMLPGRRRTLIPMQSLMIGTEPLDAEQLESIGLKDRQTFSDKRHARIYGQLTADGRIAFGGRGAPYDFGSRIAGSEEAHARVHAKLEESLKDLLPGLADAEITHRWSGVFGIPRDWYPGLLLDRETGIVNNTGYVGDGVTTTNLAGRTITDFILGEQSELLDLPWVNKAAPKWEIEPLRWIAVNAVSELLLWGDRREARTGVPSKAVAAFWKMIGN